MIETLKDKIWDFFKDYEVSLVMLYHTDGSILWHRGRDKKNHIIFIA